MRRRPIYFIVMLMVGLLMIACQQPYYGSGNVGVKDHSDAVVHINQVDPAYRKYFASQHDSNFPLQDQRKAFFEAVKTSKTPVQQDAREMAANSNKKKASSTKSASKKTKRTSKKKVVKRKTPSKKTKSNTKSKKKTSGRKKR